MTKARSYAEGIGEAVANRTINRRKPDGTIEKWEDVAKRVALGNALLAPAGQKDEEFARSHHHLRQGSVLMSGRHLQHGDDKQPTRPLEVFTNCATSASSFLTFQLLLSGAGVGRCYDDDLMVVDWVEMPYVVPVITHEHADVISGEIRALTLKEAKHMYESAHYRVHVVEDSREGWAKAIEVLEVMAYEGRYNEVLMLDFSGVRPRGAPIGGMQNRPASGPGPLMSAISKIGTIRDSQMDRWRSAMYVDHYLAECVLVGGARRAARMSTKHWADPDIFNFISIKEGGFLWSSNNSVAVDEEFWGHVNAPDDDSKLNRHARLVLDHATQAAYFHGSGEPGFINVDKLESRKDGQADYVIGIAEKIGSERYQLSYGAVKMMTEIAKAATSKDHCMITNPCGEIALHVLGGYCVIADVVPYHAASDDDAEDAFRVATRMLIRTNLLPSVYGYEVKRTNRIGVGVTGLHEYAYARFGYSWEDLVDYNKSAPFWHMMARFKRAVEHEAYTYSKELGLTVPHTNTTIKPSGTISKLFGLTEGCHLPAMRQYMRWVQFRNDDPLIAQYVAKGYPVKALRTYEGTTIVGFPTEPAICTLGGTVVTAGEATPEDQYKWLKLLEKFYINGIDENGRDLISGTGNQVSFTLKFKPDVTSYEDFLDMLVKHQSQIRCCSVMPQVDSTVYEYQPEEAITKERYEMVVEELTRMAEDVGVEHVDCSTGACPITFGEKV